MCKFWENVERERYNQNDVLFSCFLYEHSNFPLPTITLNLVFIIEFIRGKGYGNG